MPSPDCSYTVHMPWIQVITWNDWPEGTSIEPAAQDQFGFAPLLTTRQGAATFKGVQPPGGWKATWNLSEAVLRLPLDLYHAREAVASACGWSTCASCDVVAQSAHNVASAEQCEAWQQQLRDAERHLVSRDSASANVTIVAVVHHVDTWSASDSGGVGHRACSTHHMFRYVDGNGAVWLATDDCEALLGDASKCDGKMTVEWPADVTHPAYVKYWLLDDTDGVFDGTEECV